MNHPRALFLFLLMLAACSKPAQEANSVATDLAAALNKENAAVAAQTHTSTSPEGAIYKADLLAAISQADRLVVTEHSYKYDDLEADESRHRDDIIYGRVEMSTQQKARFASIISGLSDNTQDGFSACIFEPHHSIQFYSGEELSSTMEICFQCSQVEWSGSSKTPPWSIYSGLESVVLSVGLSPDRDWRQLARSHRPK